MNLDQFIRSANMLTRLCRWASSFGIVALMLMISGPASAGTYDGAMGRTNYVVMTGDVNGDGQNDVLMKAVPKLVMIPIDDDLNVPVPIPVPSPTFALISSSYGVYTLLTNPGTDVLANSAWKTATQQLSYAGAAGAFASSVTITATTGEQASFVVSMAADSGVLQITSTTAPAVDTTSGGSGSPSAATPIPVAITPPMLTNPDAGTLDGQLDVGTNGAATYTMPLTVPSGTAGMTPALVLNYSSTGGNGQLGLGWQLGGLSSIQRCTKTIAQDGIAGRISFDTADRLCLDGQRLILVNGPAGDDAYWAAGAEFRTELESFSRVTRLSSGYKVETKDGRIHFYGADANSAILAEGRSDAQVLAWALARTQDRMSNFMTMAYNRDAATGEFSIKQISYGGNTEAGLAPDLAIRFVYESRADAQVQYIGGSHNDLRTRLTNVQSYIGTAADGTGGTLVRDHSLHYTASASSGRSLIDSMQACARHPAKGSTECLPKTTFEWGQGTAPVMKPLPIQPFTLSPMMMYQGDLDGSGRTSFLSFEYINGYTEVKIRMPNGTNVVRRLSFSENGMPLPKVGDLNGDGRDDLVLEFMPTKSFYCLTVPVSDGTVDFSCSTVPVYNPLATLVDIRNEKKMHLVSIRGPDVTDCYVSGAAMQCDKIAISGVIPPVIPLLVDGTDLTYRPNPLEMDLPMPLSLSKQGMSDFYRLYGAKEPTQLYAYTNVCLNLQAGLNCRNVTKLLVGAMSGQNMSRIATTGDLNGDGLTDLVYSTFTYGPQREYYADQGGKVGFDKRRTYYACLSTENGVNCGADAGLAPYSYVAFDHTKESDYQQIGDFTGDGLERLLLAYKPNPPGLTGARSVLCRFTLGVSKCDEFAYSLAFQAMTKVAVMDDSGVPAFVYKPNFSVNSYSVMSLVGPAAQDKLIAVVNGLQMREEVDYARGDDASVYRRFVSDPVERRPVYPQYAIAPGVMAKELRRSNGQGGWLRTTFKYEGAMSDAHGRGELGFGRMQTTDVQTNVVKTVELSQQFPYVGMIVSSKSTAPSAGNPVVLGQTVNRLEHTSVSLASGAKTYFPFIAGSSSTKRDLNGAELGTTTISGPNSLPNVQYDAWGNVTGSKVTVSGDGKVFVSETGTTFNNGTLAWLSVPTSVTNTKTSNGKSVTRKMSLDYDFAKGLLTSQTVQPGERDYELKSTYGRAGNVFGLINTVVESWFDPLSNAPASRTSIDTTYDPKGRFAFSSKDALGQLQFQSFDPSTGALVSRTDPNGLRSEWVVDGFGSVQAAKQPNGNESRYFVKACQGECPGGATVASITDEFNAGQRISVPQVTYSNAIGQQIRSMTWGMDGRAIVRDQRYDAFGRPFETDHARYLADSAIMASRQFYDPIGRIQTVVTFDEAGTERVSTNDYNGYITKITNPKLQVRLEKRDAIGQVTEVTDPKLGVTKFEYDPFGKLTKTTDPAGNQSSAEYGVTGHKTKLTDPDLGMNEYFVNPLGQVWKQITPVQRKLAATMPGQFTTFKYDGVGRLIDRFETDLESHWIYDTAVMGLGQLAEVHTGKPGVAQRDYRRTHTYNEFGRPSVTTLMLTDATYTIKAEYDRWDRIIRQTYQRSGGAAKAFHSRYGSTGYLDRIERGSLVLWKMTEQDASLQATKALLGNGLTQKMIFNPNTGRLTSNALTTNTGSARLQDAYEYDMLGNVSKRSQYWDQGGFQEDFTYDDLNRLETSWVMSKEKQTFAYDNMGIGSGNLTSKTGVGTYNYPAQGANAVRPHAIKSIGTSPEFSYDDNGNLKNGGGRLIDWTSFNMPLQISKGNDTATFVYGPEHERIRQDRSDGSVVIYAGLQETEIKAGAATVKTYWPHGIGVEIDRPGIATTELSWKHVDRLGSTTALTDQGGLLREKLAYDAWGKRRTIDGGATPDALDGQVDHRGFTGHEMLDKLDLVHMNGRVYDPYTARFLSADPMITDPHNGQSYNRYSYVSNNPTNFTDPTGFYQVIETVITPTITVNGQRLSPEHVVDSAKEGVKHVVFLQLGGNGGMRPAKQAQAAPITMKTRQSWSMERGSLLNPEGGIIDTAQTMFAGIESTMDFTHGLSDYGVGLMSWDQGKMAAGAEKMKENSSDTLMVVVNVVGMRGGRPRMGAGFNNAPAGPRKFFFSNCNCFVAGTLVHTKTGLKKIENIKVGELVAARDPDSGETAFQPVVRLVRNPKNEVVRVHYLDAAGHSSTLGVTAEHPFMLDGSTWVQAAKLASGDKVMTLGGELLTIQSVEKTTARQRTYNFEVEGFHTYFVGKQGAWVHNIDCGSRNAAFRAAKRDLRIPNNAQPTRIARTNLTDKKGNKIMGPNNLPLETREYHYTRADGSQVIIQEHSAGHSFGEGGRGDEGPHFNVRPIDNPRTGKVEGTQPHYNY